MYCINCGGKIEDINDNYCSSCGYRLDRNYKDEMNIREGNDGNKNNISIIFGTFSIVGSFLIIFAPFCFIVSLIGLILGFILLKKEKNILGILLNFIGLVMSILGSVLLFFIVVSIFDNGSKNKDWHEDYYNDYEHYPYETYKGERF